jgi:N-acetylated-alpha-linked acidic dipeptidase
MKRAGRALALLGACALLAAAPPRTTIYGFTALSSDAEYDMESRFLDIPSAAGALATATAVAAEPHYAGSDGDYKLAIYVRDALKSYGFDATIETLTARVDQPKKLILELIPTGVRPITLPAFVPIARRRRERAKLAANNKGAAPAPPDGLDLREIPDPADPDTANPAVGLPFIAGSADGDVTAPLVYAGRGLDTDYALLTAHEIDTHRAILLIRYGADTRTALVRRAEAHGAAGVVLYDDPADDGFGRGAVYPNGPWRPATSVQRGSVGEGITIPVLPISAANAQLLLAALHGPSAPRPWSGALPVIYPFARGPATVRLVVELQRKVTTLWNTVGILHGTAPEQALVLGAQRDAWVYGLGPGGGGIVTLLETARGLGYLAHTGWQPDRTIVVAAWDGEELGSSGSLAYIKRHGDELREGSVAYLDTSPSVTGPTFGAAAVAAIAPSIADATHQVDDPAQPGTTVYEGWAFRTRGVLPPLERPAGGSDLTPFLFGAGTPSASAGFSGPFGPYHSSFDTLQFARTISDPDFELHRTIAQIYGVAAMRLADADVVPYHFSAYVPLMRSALQSLAATARKAHVALDTRGFDYSLRRFTASAIRSDAATKRAATAADADRELEAARIIDLTAYGVDGGTAVTFPDVARALHAGNTVALAEAVARTRTTLERAAQLIAP